MIEKSGKPRCFKSIDTKTLPVTWEHNKKAWMISEIYQRWHQNFDSKMQRQNHQVLLLLDNAPSHLKDVNVTNVKLVIISANTTSMLQPPDQEIKTVKQSIESNFCSLFWLRWIRECKKCVKMCVCFRCCTLD